MAAGSEPVATTQAGAFQRATARAALPSFVGTRTASQGVNSRARFTSMAFGLSRAWAISRCMAIVGSGRCISVKAAIFASMVTDSLGNLPVADSPESMTQSVPSRIALATSVASARVGRRLVVMDSSICVAVMTGLPARLALPISCFCRIAISSIGTSTPRSPLAIIMPSAAARISSKRWMDS